MSFRLWKVICTKEFRFLCPAVPNVRLYAVWFVRRISIKHWSFWHNTVLMFAWWSRISSMSVFVVIVSVHAEWGFAALLFGVDVMRAGIFRTSALFCLTLIRRKCMLAKFVLLLI